VQKHPTTYFQATTFLLDELKRLGARTVVISSNLQIGQHGLPLSKQRTPEDPGIAVYFVLNGKEQCIPCDKWDRTEDNIKAIGKTIEALRGLDRWGAKDMVDAAFMGFKALPAPDGSPMIGRAPWYVTSLALT
jgi:hypothetical protein